MAALALCTSQAVAIKYRPYPGSVPWGGDADKPEWEDPQDHKVNYFVPNFGLDHDILDSQQNLKEMEHKYGVWKVKEDEYGNIVLPGPIDNDSYSYNV